MLGGRPLTRLIWAPEGEWEDATGEIVDRLEATLRLRALDGDTRALIFLLQALLGGVLPPQRDGKRQIEPVYVRLVWDAPEEWGAHLDP